MYIIFITQFIYFFIYSYIYFYALHALLSIFMHCIYASSIFWVFFVKYVLLLLIGSWELDQSTLMQILLKSMTLLNRMRMTGFVLG